MSTEKNALEALDKLWIMLTSAGTLIAILAFVFKEFLTGIFNKVGEWVAMNIFHKKKIEHLTQKAARADERGTLHKFIADELYNVNRRMDECVKRHEERDRKDDEREKKLAKCQERREELEIKAVKFINEARAAAIENAKLLAENSRLQGQIKRG
jgi:hypothetical protein